MKYQIKILLLSFIAEVLITFIIVPVIKKLKVGQNERDDGPETHLKKQGTPTMGGIGFVLVIIAITGLLYYDYGFRKQELEMANQLLCLAIPTICFGLIGLIDDFKKVVLHNTKGLSPSKKMLGLLLISVGYIVFLVFYQKNGTDIYLPVIRTYITMNQLLYIPFAILVMLATTNAVNLTDGIDGLATSVTAIILACLTVIGIMFDMKEIILFGSMMVGICLAFLLFNLHPAKIFMGDTGSLLLGGAICVMAIYLKMPLLLILIAVIPVLEALSVIIQVAHYKRTGSRIFKMAPLHHHFELSGWGENKVVSVFTIATLVVCFIGLMII